MADTYQTITVRSHGFTLSKIIWRRFLRPMEGLAERVLDANPGLAAKGPYLPPGTTLTMIIPDESGARASVPVVRLWGRSE